MRHFTSITQLGDLSNALEAAKYVKDNPFADQELGRNKTLLMIFFKSPYQTQHPEGCHESRNECNRA